MYTQELFQHASSSETNSGTVMMMMDDQLVDQARSGNREAFGELVRRHRERALGWASSITQDGQLAEDIVQEALVSAFLRIETLMEPGRFKYWLQRIVCNQAMMKLRRGGPNGKESSFSVLEPLHKERPNQGEGSDLDRLLFRMTTRLDEERYTHQDPQIGLMRKELYIGLYHLLKCLTTKERSIFEAHVFRQLSPGEIADELGMSLGSVYTSISRSRTKVQRERIRVYFQGFTLEKKQTGGCTRHILASPIPM
jgi:RNA polymerase sigma factor (sigma-70 family)